MRSSTPILATVLGLLAVFLLPTQSIAAGSLSMTPAIVSHTAKVGHVGAIVVANSTGRTLKITIVPRPWIQSQATGVVKPNPRHTLLSQVGLASRSFTLASGHNRSIGIALRRTPAGRSLYGAIEVIGVPTKRAKNGVTTGYRLIGSLRLAPPASQRRHKLQIGSPHRSGKTIVLGTRNGGNTIDPITGSATIAGPSGTRRVTLAAHRILPSALVNLSLGSTRGLRRGTYTVTATLRQAGHTMGTRKAKVKVG
jgi:hypothetical protein